MVGCSAGVGVAGRDLYVSERDAGVEGGNDERGSQHVGVHGTETGPLSDRPNPAMRCAPVEALTVSAPQDRSLVALTDHHVIVRAVRGTSGIMAGMLPSSTIRNMR